MAILNSNLIPLPNAPFGCNFSLTNFNSASPDPNDPNRCYNAAVSPSTYWREELFRIDQTLNNKGASSRFAISMMPGIRRADAAVELPERQQPSVATFPTVQNPVLWAWNKPGGAADAADIDHTAERSGRQLRESNITLTDQNGPGAPGFSGILRWTSRWSPTRRLPDNAIRS